MDKFNELMRPKYSVVIPVYNTTDILLELCDRIESTLQLLNEPYEIIFVDDCSPNPKTWKTLQEIVALKEKVTAAHLLRNFGQQAATMCGLSLARGEYIITMDDDLQHDPSNIPRLIEQKHHHIVIGNFLDKKHSFMKRFTSKLKERFDRIIFDKPKDIQLSAFRLLNRRVVDVMLQIKTPNPYVSALMFFASKDVVGVSIDHNERQEGVSGYSFIQLIKLFSYLIINNSSLALKFIGQLGLISLGFSAVFILITLFKYFTYNNIIPGWTSVMLGLFFFGGIQLFSIGIIGEYLIRIIGYSEGKPSFVIGEIYHTKKEYNHDKLHS